MEIKALQTFTAFDGAMRVFNEGDRGELRDDLAQGFIAAGLAKAVGTKPAKPEAAVTAEAEQAPAA